MANDRVQAKIDLLKGKDQTNEAKNSIESFGSSVKRIGEIAAGVGLERLGEQILSIGKNAAQSALQTGLNFEQWKMSFDTMLGSAERGSKLFSDISEFAKKTPFELTDLVQSSKQLIAYNFAQEDIVKTTRMLGDVSAGIGSPIGELVYLYGTLRAQNIAYTKDLNQFTARGIPVLDLLAEKFKVSKDKVLDMASQSKISFKDIESVFQKMTGSGGLYFGMMQRQSETLGGIVSNLKDNFTQLGLSVLGFDMNKLTPDGKENKHFGQINEGSMFDELRKSAKALLEYLDTHKKDIEGFAKGSVTVVTSFVKEGVAAFNNLKTTLQNVKQFWNDHRIAILSVATAITIYVLPALVALAIAQAVNGVQSMIAFGVQIATGIASFASYTLSAWAAVGSNIAFGAANLLMATRTLIANAILSAYLVLTGKVTFGQLAAAAATGIWSMATAAWGVVVAIATSPITLMIAAIAGLLLVGYTLVTHWQQVKNIGVEVWKTIGNAIKWAINSAIEAYNSFSKMVEKVTGGMVKLGKVDLKLNYDNVNFGGAMKDFKMNPLESWVSNSAKGFFNGNKSGVNTNQQMNVGSSGVPMTDYSKIINITNNNTISNEVDLQSLSRYMGFQVSGR